MTGAYWQLTGMIEFVARALGNELLQNVAFVGGCVTGLLITDEFTKEEIRYTDDVDLIVNVAGYGEWAALRERLRTKGFLESMEGEADITCRMRLGDLKVDFMPDDEAILGYSNRWYADALMAAEEYRLADDLSVKVLTPPYFVATKLEAYKGRGGDDPLASHDLEDILNLIDGRKELLGEIGSADAALRVYIADEIGTLLQHEYFDYAVQSTVRGDEARADIIYERLEAIKALKGFG